MRERKIINPDLDIFGGSAEEGSVDEESKASGEESSMDIFGGALENEPVDEGGADTETVEPPVDESTEESAEDPVEESTETPEEETTEAKIESEVPEIYDGLLDELFNEIENEVKGNKDLMGLIEELRKSVAEKEVDNNILKKQNESLNDRLLSNVGSQEDYGVYKGVLNKLETNPQLMVFAKYYGDTGDEKIKNKLINIASDFIFNLTGQDISDIIDTKQADKVSAMAGGGSSAPTSLGKEDVPEENMNFEESISKLF